MVYAPFTAIELLLVIWLLVFAALFAVNIAVFSFLILAYREVQRLSWDVGFYYMPNAMARLAVTVLSRLIFQFYGLFYETKYSLSMKSKMFEDLRQNNER